MNEKIANDLIRYAELVEDAALISPEEMNCASLMRLAAEALVQPKPEPFRPGFAGVTLWLGDAQVTQIVTDIQIKYERERGQALTMAAQKCLDIYANARGTRGNT